MRDCNRTLGMPMIRNRCAFTLIELLIVVAIIAILAAIAVPNFLEAQVRAKVSRAKADMRTIATAVETYVVDNNRPPVRRSRWNQGAPRFYPEPDKKIFDPAVPSASVGMHVLTTPIAYITSIPSDPFNLPFRSLMQPGNGYSDALEYWDDAQADSFVAFAKYQGFVQNIAGLGKGYLLLSMGPDQYLGLLPVNGWPWSDGTRNTYMMIYDPTNGSVSYGNIFRSPGGLEQKDLIR